MYDFFGDLQFFSVFILLRFAKKILSLHRFWCLLLFSQLRIKGNSVQIRNNTRCCKFLFNYELKITNYELNLDETTLLPLE